MNNLGVTTLICSQDREVLDTKRLSRPKGSSDGYAGLEVCEVADINREGLAVHTRFIPMKEKEVYYGGAQSY